MSNMEYLQIGPKITEARKQQRLSQSLLGERLDLYQQNIARYEADAEGKMSISKACEFAEALDLTLIELLQIEIPAKDQKRFPPASAQTGPQTQNELMAIITAYAVKNPEAMPRIATMISMMYESGV